MGRVMRGTMRGSAHALLRKVGMVFLLCVVPHVCAKGSVGRARDVMIWFLSSPHGSERGNKNRSERTQSSGSLSGTKFGLQFTDRQAHGKRAPPLEEAVRSQMGEDRRSKDHLDQGSTQGKVDRLEGNLPSEADKREKDQLVSTECWPCTGPSRHQR